MDLLRVVFLEFFVFIASVESSRQQEFVLVRDRNSDHDRRHLDGGLPSSLNFEIIREAGDVKLALEENNRLNPNAPVYDIKKDNDGSLSLVRKDVPPITDLQFYQDIANGGTFSVRCKLSPDGPCSRLLNGNLYIDGENYDLEPAPEVRLKRSLDFGDFGIPHFLTRNKINVNSTMDRTRAVDIPDTKDIPDNQDVTIDRDELMKELREVLERKRANDNYQTEANESYEQRNKGATHQYAVEIYVTLDQTVWKRYYDITEETDTLTKTEATELRLREHFSHIINGVSLRYQSIEDPEMQIYCTLSGFLIIKERSATNPFPLGEEITINGREYADADLYLDSMIDWVQKLTGLPSNDHIMVFTGYELYFKTIDQHETDGLAFTRGICRRYRLSVNQIADFFGTTSIATHELGHNLGAPHDGSGSAEACKAEDAKIMAPMLAHFTDEDEYSGNPWTFSTCSVEAFKAFFARLAGSRNLCLEDSGDYYSIQEFQEHISKLPGERYSMNAQCKLLEGENSGVCQASNPDNNCLVLKCLTTRQSCRYYTPARGTECGGTDSNMWCIDGQCVPKFTVWNENGLTLEIKAILDIETTRQVAPSTTHQPCVDTGFAGIADCATMRTWYYDMDEFCDQLNSYCCETCAALNTEITIKIGVDRRNPCYNKQCTTTMSTTTVYGQTSLFPCEGDVGYDGTTCLELEEMLGSRKTVCTVFTHECCLTCASNCKKNKVIRISGTKYTCEEVLSKIFIQRVNAFCRVYGRKCCKICTPSM